MANRDEIEILGYNSRLDTLQAVVGNWLIPQTADITAKRIENGAYYDRHLGEIAGVKIPSRSPRIKRVFHLYMVFAEHRDELHRHCLSKGISAKVHYPIPVYRQRGLSHFGHKLGDFPVTDRQADQVLSFPVDQHLAREEQDYVIETVREFYRSRL
jgi:dTDP-4-amino-4,6-dideoxygalactose transaminase